MTITPMDLTVEIRSQDGSSTEFYQDNEEETSRTLGLLVTPRLLAQPHLVLASDQGISMIPCRGIDMILARTSARTPLVLPLIFPAGLLDLVEEPQDWPHNDTAATEAVESRKLSPVTSYVEVHTFGGWVVTLRALVMSNRTVHDRRQLFAHFLGLPIVAFRLMDGGIGLINPANITRVSVWPAPDDLPESALPLGLLRWRPVLRRGGIPTPVALSGQEYECE
jgi:hypothetical protein